MKRPGAAAEVCANCRPLEEHPDDGGAVHLSRLARGIVDYVLEAVLIHLEHEHPMADSASTRASART